MLKPANKQLGEKAPGTLENLPREKTMDGLHSLRYHLFAIRSGPATNSKQAQ